MDAGDDYVLCPGQNQVQLSGTIQGSAFQYFWAPAGQVGNPQNLMTTGNVSGPAEFILTASVNTGMNIIFNGDFEAGNVGFTTAYTVGTTPCYNLGYLDCEGTYDVITNPQSGHPNWAPCQDHTTGSGNMMVINGAGSLQIIWCQEITVMPNTLYIFQAFGASVISSSPAQLQFSVDGTPIGSVLNLGSTTCNWQQFYAIWNSGNQTDVEICIINQNTAASGNDFALDDIGLFELCQVSDTVAVEIVDLAIYIQEPDLLDCNSPQNCTMLTGTVTSNGTPDITWTATDGGTIVSGSNTTTPAVCGPGTFTMSVSSTLNGITCEEPPVSVYLGYDNAPPPQIFLQGNDQYCLFEEGYFSIEQNPAYAEILWTIGYDFDQSVIGNGVNEVYYTFDQPGFYTLCAEVINICGISETECLEIEVLPEGDEAQISGPTSLCETELVQYYIQIEDPELYQFFWTLPAGAAIIGGQFSNVIEVDWNGIAGGTVCAIVSNICGSWEHCLDVTIGGGPDIYELVAPDDFCFEDTIEIIAIIDPNYSGFAWSLSPGVSVIGDPTAESALFSQVIPEGVQICLQLWNSCDTTELCIQLKSSEPPAPPGIAGPAFYCEGDTLLYIASYGAGISGLEWMLNIPADIISSPTSDSILVVFSTTDTVSLCLEVLNDCGTSMACQKIVPLPGTQDPVLTGPDTICLGETAMVGFQPLNYSSLQWTHSGTGSISFGSDTTVVQVTSSSGGVMTICLGLATPCSFGSSCKEVWVLDTLQHLEISGTDTICAISAISEFTIGVQANVDLITWDLGAFSSEAQILSGQGSNLVEIDWGQLSGNVQICVSVQGGCNEFQSCRNLYIYPPLPDANILGPGIVCAGDTVTFAIDQLQVTSLVNWTVDESHQIIGNGNSASVSIIIGNAFPSTVCVNVQNACESKNACMTINSLESEELEINYTCDPQGVGQDTIVMQNQFGCDSLLIYQTLLDAIENCIFSLQVEPGPADCKGNPGSVAITVSQGLPPFNLSVLDASGSLLANIAGVNADELHVVSDLMPGNYLLVVADINGNEKEVPFEIGEISGPSFGLQVISNYSGFPVSCNGEIDGEVQAVDIEGGTKPYNLFWSSGQEGEHAAGLAAGQYIVTLTDGNQCEALDSVTLLEPPELTAIIEVSDPLCFGEDNGFIQIIEIEGGVPPYLVRINDGQWQADNTFSMLGEDTYTVEVSDLNGCNVLESFIVVMPDPLSVSLTGDTIAQYGDSVLLIAHPSIDAGHIEEVIWDPPQECRDCLEMVVAATQARQFQVTITDENGCEARDKLNLNIEKNTAIYIPNVFSPNGDGNNDFFYVQQTGFIERIFLMEIYDRWGEIVFSNKEFLPDDPVSGWNGKWDSEELNPAVFVYRIIVEFTDGSLTEYTGDVTLVR